MKVPHMTRLVSLTTRFAALVLMALVVGASSNASPQHMSKCVNADNGYPLKGITRRATALCDKPDPNCDRQMPLKAFQYVYILPPDPDGPRRYSTLVKDGDITGLMVNGMYRVGWSLHGGDSSSDQAGYIAGEDLQLWEHIQALQFTRLEDRDPALFFQPFTSSGGGDESEEARTEGAIDRLRSYYGGEDPDADFREPVEKGDDLFILPMLGLRQVEIEEEEMDLYECAFLAGPIGGVTSGEPVEAAATEGGAPSPASYESATADVGLDLVFVIDTTMSMQPAIDNVLKSIRKVAKKLGEADLPALRIGLVGYRDDKSDLDYVAKVFCDLNEGADLSSFLRAVEDLEVAKNGSGEWAEDVFAGLHMGLDSGKVGWKEDGSVNWNLLVLVGDASGHPVGEEKNTTKRDQHSILEMAQPENPAPNSRGAVQFFVQHVLHNETPDDDQAMFETQFRYITESAPAQGLFAQTHRDVDFSGDMADEILRALKLMAVAIDYRGTIPEDKLDEMKGPKVSPKPMLERLRKLARATEGSPDSAVGPQFVAFDKAFCGEMGPDGSRQFVPHVFIEKSQLETYVSTLGWLRNNLIKAGDPGKKDVAAIVKEIKTFTALINLGVDWPEDELKEMEIRNLLMAMSGVPSKSGIFSLSVSELSQMAASDWDEWLNEIQSAITILSTHLDTPSKWWPLGDGVKESDYHAFIKISELP